MFELIRKEGAEKFDVYRDYLVIINSQQFKLYKDDNLQYSNNLDDDINDVNILDSETFFLKRSDNTVVVLRNSSSGYQLSQEFGEFPISEINERKDIALSSTWISYSPVEIKSQVIELKNGTVLWSSNNISSCLMMGDFLFSREYDHLVVYNLGDGTIKSKLHLTPYLTHFVSYDGSKIVDEIQNYIGLIENILWISLRSGRLLSFNIEIGSLEDLIDFKRNLFPYDFLYKVNEDDYLPFGELMQLDKSLREIIGLRDKYFMRINLTRTEPRREYISLEKSMNSYNIISSYRNQAFPYDQNYIYFCDDRKGKIGVFDREKLEVVWSYELEMKRNGIAQILDMKYANNRWYIQDRNNVLHVFEKVS